MDTTDLVNIDSLLFDGLSLGIIVLDDNYCVSRWNKWMEKTTFLQTEEVLGKNIFDLFPDIKKQNKDTFIYNCYKTQTPTFLSPLFHNYLIPIDFIIGNEKIKMLQNCKLLPTIFGNNKKGLVIIIENFTENIYHDNELESLNNILTKNILELTERNEELDTFSHTVAHDLKNPISSIINFAELILERHTNLTFDEIKKYIKIVLQSGKKTVQIIDSLLLFASVTKTEVKTEQLNMGEIVSKSLSRLSLSIEQNNVTIQIPDTWPISFGYSSWIEEIWTNYLSNAIKYGGSPPIIEIGYDLNNIDELPNNMIRFWVRDNGPGISVKDQEKVFNKFERLNQVKTEGHGLGLSIVKRIVEKLGGKICIESDERGSLFCFTLASNR